MAAHQAGLMRTTSKLSAMPLCSANIGLPDNTEKMSQQTGLPFGIPVSLKNNKEASCNLLRSHHRFLFRKLRLCDTPDSGDGSLRTSSTKSSSALQRLSFSFPDWLC
jgi:hypothetical protein